MGTLLTWNVAGRVGPNQERQIAALAERSFDVLCLQEFTPRTRARWVAALEERGLHVAVSEWPVEPRGARRVAALVASRRPPPPAPPAAPPGRGARASVERAPPRGAHRAVRRRARGRGSHAPRPAELEGGARQG